MGDRAEDVRPKTQPTLHDGVVWLTPFRIDDAAAIGEFNVDDAHRRWFDQPPVDEDPAARRAHGEDVARRWLAAWATGEQLVFAVRLSDEAEAIGMAELQPRAQGAANISYAIRPAWRGHGYAARAVRLLADAGVERFGFRRIELRCDPDNEASARTAARAGFTFERRDPGAGGVYEHVDDWGNQPRDELVFSRELRTS